MALSDVIKAGREHLEAWRQSIINPEQFLKPEFNPTDDELNAGIEFYIIVFVVAFLLTAPVSFMHKGETIDKAKVAINAALGLLFLAMLSAAWHVSFWILGGKASFSGTFLTYIYAAGPYLPILAFCSLILVSGIPKHLRPYVLNPATSKKAMEVAMEDPETSKGLVGLAGLAALGLGCWCVYVIWSCLSLIQAVTGWNLAGVIVISIFISIPVNFVLKGVGALFQDQSGLDPKLVEDISRDAYT